MLSKEEERYTKFAQDIKWPEKYRRQLNAITNVQSKAINDIEHQEDNENKGKYEITALMKATFIKMDNFVKEEMFQGTSIEDMPKKLEETLAQELNIAKKDPFLNMPKDKESFWQKSFATMKEIGGSISASIVTGLTVVGKAIRQLLKDGRNQSAGQVKEQEIKNNNDHLSKSTSKPGKSTANSLLQETKTPSSTPKSSGNSHNVADDKGDYT